MEPALGGAGKPPPPYEGGLQMRSKTLNLRAHYCLKSTLTSLAVGLDNHQGQLSANPAISARNSQASSESDRLTAAWLGAYPR
jgi:hypothetical protein